MDEQDGGNNEPETITDIQNYLASFNKEIQDGSSTTTATNNAHIETTDVDAEENTSTASNTTTTFYVTQNADGTPVEGYHYDSADAQYGTTYFASPDGTYYAATSQGGADALAAYTAQGATVVPVAAPAGAFQTTAGLQQIVLAVSDPNGGATGAVDVKQQEIVAIPAALTTQAGGQEQTAYVAMQAAAAGDVQMDSGEGSPQPTLATLVADNGPLEADSGPTHSIRMVLRQPDGTEMEQTIPISSARVPTLVTSDGQEIHVNDEGTLQMMATLAEQAASGGLGDGSNQVIVNVGNTYQTVTVVPTDGGQGEMSYMLIVSQSDDDKDVVKDMDLDMSVYDFNEGDKQHGEIVSEEVAPDGTKTRTIRITQKKSQIVTQAHMCNYCNYTSPKRYLLSRHMKSHSEERPHKCGVCERGFKTLAALQNHVNTHTGTRPHCCRDCDSAFTTSGELVRHVRYRHTHEKPHKCTECDYASVELSKLKRHMRCHTGERPYQCPHCTYASPDMYKLKRHLRIHTGEKPYECDVCQARFTQSNSLKAHKLIHSGNKPAFHCEFCPTTCGRKTDLRIHMQKLHTSDKPLKCKRCGKTFPDRYSFKLHSKTHEGEKCFKCDLCPYASISQRHLESHMLIHTDQKPFRCDECDQAFRQKQLLRRHKNLYHDPNYVPPVPKEKTNECSECGKAFRHKGNLIRHLAIHDPDASENDKAEALRIGAPKAPGELRDGEEDEEEETELHNDFPGTIQLANPECSQEGDNQVVVFEVIQLHSQEAKAAAMSEEDGMTMANGESTELTMLRDVVDEGCFVNAVDEAIMQDETSGLQSATPKKRGRPKKKQTQDLLKNAAVEIAKEEPTTKPQRRRRNSTKEIKPLAELLEEVSQKVPTNKPARNCRLKKEDAASVIEEIPEEPLQGELFPIDPLVTDKMELARREAELTKRRLQQKEKDMAECFGFNDDDDDAETILAMPAVPGSHAISTTGDNTSNNLLLNHTGGDEHPT